MIHILINTLGQQTQEQQVEARRLLEHLQATERKKQQIQFQLQQLHLGLQQAKAAQAMEQEFKKTLKIEVDQLSKSQQIKLVLRKR